MMKNASVQYSLDKRPKDMWNFVIGTQYQHNKHWMIRAEFGFLGSRTASDRRITVPVRTVISLFVQATFIFFFRFFLEKRWLLAFSK